MASRQTIVNKTKEKTVNDHILEAELLEDEAVLNVKDLVSAIAEVQCWDEGDRALAKAVNIITPAIRDAIKIIKKASKVPGGWSGPENHAHDVADLSKAWLKKYGGSNVR